MPTTNEIVSALEGRIAELGWEIEQLEAARRALAGDGGVSQTATRRSGGARGSTSLPPGPARTTRGSRRASTPRRRRARASAEQIESILGQGNGMSTATVAEAAGASHERTLAILRELETAGQIRRSGVRRATRWHAITDEDRIAARAAEIAAAA